MLLHLICCALVKQESKTLGENRKHTNAITVHISKQQEVCTKCQIDQDFTLYINNCYQVYHSKRSGMHLCSNFFYQFRLLENYLMGNKLLETLYLNHKMKL